MRTEVLHFGQSQGPPPGPPPPGLLQWGPHDSAALRYSFFIVILWLTSGASLERHSEASKGGERRDGHVWVS